MDALVDHEDTKNEWCPIFAIGVAGLMFDE